MCYTDVMVLRFLRTAFATVLLALPVPMWALETRTWTIRTAAGSNLPQLTADQFIGNLIFYLSYLIGFVTTALFLVGALYVVIARGQPDKMEKGKKLMIESLIGMAIVLGAYAILRTVAFIVVHSA